MIEITEEMRTAGYAELGLCLRCGRQLELKDGRADNEDENGEGAWFCPACRFSCEA